MVTIICNWNWNNEKLDISVTERDGSEVNVSTWKTIAFYLLKKKLFKTVHCEFSFP